MEKNAKKNEIVDAEALFGGTLNDSYIEPLIEIYGPKIVINKALTNIIYENDSWEASFYSARLGYLLSKPAIAAFHSLLNDDKINRKVRFFYFRMLFTRHRHHDNYSEMSEMLDRYREVFTEEPMYEFLEGVRMKLSEDPAILFTGVEIIDRIAERYDKSGNPAILQAYADGVARALDKDMIDTGFQKETHLPKALRRITHAISRKTYPKYHYTRAMLHLHRGNYAKSREDTLTALDLHKIDTLAEVQRASIYRMFLLRIENQKALSRLEDLEQQSNKIRDDLRNERSRSVEFIGVFSALIALVISTTTLLSASGLGFLHSLMILTVLAGILLILIEAMMVRLQRKGNWKEPLGFVIAGIVLVVIGVAVGLLNP